MEYLTQLSQKEEEKDLTEAVVNKEISVSLNIIPDGYYKILVGIIGCFICFYLKTDNWFV